MGSYYCNGTGGANRRYITIKNVQAGDRIRLYAGALTATKYYFEGQGTAAGQMDEAVLTDKALYGRFDFIAAKTGTYKIWESGSAKPVIHRIMRFPVVNVSGKVTPGSFNITGSSVKMTNTTTNEVTKFDLADDGSFEGMLSPGYTYNAAITGASGCAITKSSRSFEISETAGVNNCMVGDLSFELEAQTTRTLSGTITGFASGYDMSDMKLVMMPESPDLEAVELTVMGSSFSGNLVEEEKYTYTLSGARDYEIVSKSDITLTDDVSGDEIRVAPKATYAVTGGFMGLEVGDAPSKLVFESVDDSKYSYEATLTGSGYNVNLRDGAYLAKATITDYKTSTHVVVDKAATEKDIFFDSTKKKSTLTPVKDIYVGYPDKENNYATIALAMDACERMAPAGENDRITVHIAPGIYREQVFVKAPYVTWTNDGSGEVLVTWYYGTDYKYYSANASGFYDAALAYDKYDKKKSGTWGTTVYIDKGATGFRAVGITFENSFNRYLTDEELEDGVELVGAEGNTTQVRKKGVDVQAAAATERATAICNYANHAEFEKCSFLGSQDTLFTGNANTQSYYKNCFIEGMTDYIFGDGDAVFDACELSFKGYSSGAKGGYITAGKHNEATKGYLFRRCSITANSKNKLTVPTGYLS